MPLPAPIHIRTSERMRRQRLGIMLARAEREGARMQYWALGWLQTVSFSPSSPSGTQPSLSRSQVQSSFT
ncbi:adenylate cyclase (plasmid) [Sinorhizobium americanum CCGM7]|nr:adenylate cyclase [Sinorhizobium americanum CCGM7]